MNKRELMLRRKETRNKYKIAGSSSFSRRAINAIYLHRGNRVAKDIDEDAHEKGIVRICYWLLKSGMQFITQAERSGGEYKGDILDIVVLDNGKEIEVVYKNDSEEVIKRYKEAERTIAFADDKGNIINENEVKTELEEKCPKKSST